MIRAGYEAIDYRIAIDPDTKTDETSFIQRLHYLASINPDFMWHLIAQTRKANDTDIDFDYLQAQFIFDLGEDGQSLPAHCLMFQRECGRYGIEALD